MSESGRPLLEMQGIVKDFPGVRALDHVTLALNPGEVHALVGANGAGKSTLMKVLGGVYRDYGGTILIEGSARRIHSPRQALQLGIAVIHQEFSLVPQLSVAENIMLGREPRRKTGGRGIPLLDRPRLYAEAERLLAALGFRIPEHARVSELGVAEQQMVQIAKAMASRSRILVMDEPTARLSRTERDDLFAIMRRLKAAGTGIIYISHFLEEVFMVADRVTVLRDGRTVAAARTSDLTRHDLVRLMLGREVEQAVTAKDRRLGREVLRVKGLSEKSGFTDVSFAVREGEILGIAGLVGSGRTELARSIFGAGAGIASGSMTINGVPCTPRSPGEAITRGLGLLPEDRKRQGLVLVGPVADNILLAVCGHLRRGPFLDHRARAGTAQRMMRRLQIKCPSPLVPVSTLSGGNQQKTVLAKWLASEPKVLILDQPTAGIDVGTKEEIYAFLNELADAGAALVVISDDPGELARLCNRVLIMRKGRIVRELPDHPSSEEVLAGVTADY